MITLHGEKTGTFFVRNRGTFYAHCILSENRKPEHTYFVFKCYVFRSEELKPFSYCIASGYSYWCNRKQYGHSTKNVLKRVNAFSSDRSTKLERTRPLSPSWHNKYSTIVMILCIYRLPFVIWMLVILCIFIYMHASWFEKYLLTLNTYYLFTYRYMYNWYNYRGSIRDKRMFSKYSLRCLLKV